MKFNVPEMSCGHCKATIENAIGALDADAKVAVDLGSRTIVVESSRSATDIAAALDAAGYGATPVAA